MMPTMISIKTRYLRLPVSNAEGVPCRKITVRENGTLVYDLDVFLANENAPKDSVVIMYADLKPFLGKALSFHLLEEDGSETDYAPDLTDHRAGECDYLTHLRPMVHFTTRYGWTNDPNGLVFADNVYHMFYQHNPAGTRWGNMHWGHATSGDLIHWVERDEALYPDKTGTMFSGSAIADTDNVTGLKDGDYTPILLFYTAAGNNSLLSKDVPFAQYLAYSTDGGMTFHKYSDEPILPHIAGANRDPKVIWAEELNAWVLALYLDGREYRLFTSDDLLHWTAFDNVTMPEDAECPDFYPLVCRDTGERLWVFSGASDTYLVGQLSRNGFAPIQEPAAYRVGGGGSYAAQTFSGLGDRVVKIAWGQMHAPGAEFESQMLFPADVSLRKDPDGKYRLSTWPIEDIHKLYMMDVTLEKYATSQNLLRCQLKGGAYDLTVRWAKGSAPMHCQIYGVSFTIYPDENRIALPDREIPITYTGRGTWEERCVRILIDTISMEVFADEGRIYTALTCYPDFADDEFRLQPAEGDEVGYVSVTLAPLYRIWG